MALAELDYYTPSKRYLDILVFGNDAWTIPKAFTLLESVAHSTQYSSRFTTGYGFYAQKAEYQQEIFMGLLMETKQCANVMVPIT
jgi:hypothetical protein